MLGYALKKLMYNLSLCLTAYMLIFFFRGISACMRAGLRARRA